MLDTKSETAFEKPREVASDGIVVPGKPGVRWSKGSFNLCCYVDPYKIILDFDSLGDPLRLSTPCIR